MGDRVAIISRQPKLASQEDITDEVICAIPQASLLDDPLFEPLKATTNVQIRQIFVAADIDDAEDLLDSKYEIRNAAKKLGWIATKRTGSFSTSKCHDGQLACTIQVETVQGQPVIHMEGVPGYSGLARMRVWRTDQVLGEVVQRLDWCAACNPDYIVKNAEGEDLIRISVLDGGFFCGLFGVRKFMIISGDNQTIVGEIVNETALRASGRKRKKKLVADEQSPLINIRIAMSDELDVLAKTLIIAAAFTVNFHDTVFRFKKQQDYEQQEEKEEEFQSM